MNKYLSEFADFVEFYDLIAKVSEDIVGNAKVHSKDGREVIAACLLVRIRSNYRAIRLLLNAGYISEALVMLRCMTEAYIHLRNVEKSETYFRSYILSDHLLRRKKLEAFKKSPIEPFDVKQIEKQIEQLDHEIAKKKISGTNLETLAQNVGEIETYCYVYRITSDTVHVAARDIEKCVRYGENETVRGFDNDKHVGPDTAVVLLSSIATFMKSVQCFCKVLDIPISPDLEERRRELFAKHGYGSPSSVQTAKANEGGH